MAQSVASPPGSTELGSAVSPPRSRHQPASLRILPPLSALTYFRRNLLRVSPVFGAIVVAVFLITCVVTLLNSVDATIQTDYGFSRHCDNLTTRFEDDVPFTALAQASALPEVGRVVVTYPWVLDTKTVFGQLPTPIYGVSPSDIPFLLQVSGNHLAPGGRWPRPGQAEVVLSRGLANNFHVGVGERFTPTFNDGERTALNTQTLVGILDGGDALALADATTFRESLPFTLIRPNYLYFPRTPEEHPALTRFLLDMLDHPERHGLEPSDAKLLDIWTFDKVLNDEHRILHTLFVFLWVVDVLVIGVIALLSGFLANIYFEQRLGEFGLLSALGFTRGLLAGRLMRESALLVVSAWATGVLLAHGAHYLANQYFVLPRGLILADFTISGLGLSLPTPLLVALASLSTMLWRLWRLDPIQILERR